jgi:hypothetical protein
MKLIKALCAVLALGMAQNSLAGESYSELPWREFATVEAVNNSELYLDVLGAVGQYIRIEYPTSCGNLDYGLSATGTPVNPRLRFNIGAGERNPDTTTHYWLVVEERNIQFKKLFIEHIGISEKSTCNLTLSFAEKSSSSEQCGEGVEVFAEAHAFSNVGAHVAKELAWNRMHRDAVQQCQSPNVCRIPGRSGCSGSARGNNWNYECHGWFVCN